MSDDPNQANPSPTPPAAAPGAPAAPSTADAAEGKVLAILSYALNILGVPFFLIPLFMRNNDFALYHAKQCLLVWLFGIATGTVGVLLIAVCVGIVLLPAAMIFMLVVSIIGIINAANLQARPLPLIGVFAEQWFVGIRKV